MPTPRKYYPSDPEDGHIVPTAYDHTVSPTPPVPPVSFDVTQVIGTVVIDPHSTRTAREVAFSLIANFGDDGKFTFPNPDGTTTSVTVEHTAH